LLGSFLLLVHIVQSEASERVHNAWLRTIEDGIHTYDIFTEGVSTQKVGTKEFAAAVCDRLGQKPNTLKAVTYAKGSQAPAPSAQLTASNAKMELKGVDVFVYWPSRDANQLAEATRKLGGDGLSLQMIDNRGVKVWPAGRAETFCTDSFRCRYMADGAVDAAKLIDLQKRIAGAGIEIASTQMLRTFDGQPGFSLAQGQ
jgi:isocitrate dehydrogenase